MTESVELRSRTMRSVHSSNTGPELAARRLLRNLGYSGYRVNRKELPGKPDICFIGLKKALFVHGCFWHGHTCRHGSNKPKSNQSYWLPKIERNEARDKANAAKLAQLGWSVQIIWECELRKPDELTRKLIAFMKD
jgi:DNA mismatch endonuclease (patch repair protein)